MKLRDVSFLVIGILITGIFVVTAKPHSDYTQMYIG